MKRESMSETRGQNFSKSEENNLEVYGIVVTSSRHGEAAGRGCSV